MIAHAAGDRSPLAILSFILPSSLYAENRAVERHT
jgi:hypothetical protein